MKVVYGHTDSIYVKCDSVEKGQEAVEYLNKKVQKLFPNILGLEEHPVQLEFEKYFKSLGVGVTKNRNAGLIVWKDGEYLTKDEFSMTGFTAKRQTITKLGKETQTTVLDMWVKEFTEAEITDYLHSLYFNVLGGEIPVGDVLTRTRFKESRFRVHCTNCRKNGWKSSFTLHELMDRKEKGRECCDRPDYVTGEGKRPVIGSNIEGVLYHDTISENPIGDSYLYLKISQDVPATYTHPFSGKSTRPSYFSFLTEKDLEESPHSPDWRHYAESVLKKAAPIYSAMGWDLLAIKQDRNQSGLEDWLV